MKYAAVVLFNQRNTLAVVEYQPVTDSLLAGGIFLDEIVFTPYDAPSTVGSALARLATECAGIFVIADSVLLPEAKKSVEIAAVGRFEEDYILETKTCLYAVLPTGMGGAELVKSDVVPRVDSRRNTSYFRVVLRTMGAPADVLRDAVTQARTEGVNIHVAERYADARIELLYDKSTPKFNIDEATRILATALRDYLYALEDVSIAERLVEALKIRRRRVSVAESFTGGGVGRAIVRVSGASDVYYEGLNTYNEKSKQDRLGVTQFTVKQRGTVSDETAYEMAAGLLATGSCDLAVATTGVAGPDPDEKGNPVGLCYIAAGTKEQVNVYKYQLSGDRETITETAINLALFLAYKELK